jgi:hypothetical protein
MAIRAAIPFHQQPKGKPDKVPQGKAMPPTACYFRTQDNFPVFSTGTACQTLEVFPNLSDK